MTPSFEEQIQATRAGSGAWYKRAQQAIGGALGHDVRHALPFPTYVARAQGAYKWDVDGHRYIDYHVGNGALLLGQRRASCQNGWKKIASQFGASPRRAWRAPA